MKIVSDDIVNLSPTPFTCGCLCKPQVTEYIMCPVVKTAYLHVQTAPFPPDPPSFVAGLVECALFRADLEEFAVGTLSDLRTNG